MVSIGRPGATINNVANCRFALVELDDVSHAGSTTPIGLLIAPDNEVITGMTKTLSWNLATTFGNTQVTEEQLDEYLTAGCVFIPASGKYDGQ